MRRHHLASPCHRGPCVPSIWSGSVAPGPSRLPETYDFSFFYFMSRNFHVPQGKLRKVGSEETPGIGTNPRCPLTAREQELDGLGPGGDSVAGARATEPGGHFLSKSRHGLPCGNHIPSWDTGVEAEGAE